jgi:hypothetical protein
VAWPVGVASFPVAMSAPSEFGVILGHIARCPLYDAVRGPEPAVGMDHASVQAIHIGLTQWLSPDAPC